MSSPAQQHSSVQTLLQHTLLLKDSIARLGAVPTLASVPSALHLVAQEPSLEHLSGGLLARLADSAPPDPLATTAFVAAGCQCELVQVVCSLRFSPVLGRPVLSARGWAEKLALRCGTPLQFTLQAPGGAATTHPNTTYDPATHPARSLLLGPRLTALVYPTGVIVATGTGLPVAAVAAGARDAVEVSMQVAGVRLDGGEPALEALVVHALVPGIADAVARDPLLFDRLAALFPSEAEWEPELLPALVLHVTPRHGRPPATIVVTEGGVATVGGCRSHEQVAAALQTLAAKAAVAGGAVARGRLWRVLSEAAAEAAAAGGAASTGSTAAASPSSSGR